tara:strand:- start:7416 stop:7751 length:336 start_codon:yes stop_codon:yes gene_type:complete
MNLLKPDETLRNGYKDPKHLARVGNLGCSLCFFLGVKQTSRTAVHHYHGGGMGKKASDLRVMSLCDLHHQKGEFAFHHIGRVAFEEKFGIDQEGLIEITNKMLEDKNNANI